MIATSPFQPLTLPQLPRLEDLLEGIAFRDSAASAPTLQQWLHQLKQEQKALQPHLQALEDLQGQLSQLRQHQQSLQVLQTALETLLKAQQSGLLEAPLPMGSSNIAAVVRLLEGKQGAFQRPSGLFYPEKAFEAANTILKRKQSINYEMFRAICYAGGFATSQQIRHFLMEQQVQAPRSKQPFDESVPLSEITARVDYLVKKGLVQSDGNARFWSTVGWED